MDADDTTITIFAVIALLAIFIFGVRECREEERRQDRIIRECKLVGHIKGQSVIVSTDKGVGVGSTSDQRCYLCPNGIQECF